MFDSIRRSAMTVAALGALGLGGSAIAGAAQDSSSLGTSSSRTTYSQTRDGRSPRPALASSVGAKAAALKKVPGDRAAHGGRRAVQRSLPRPHLDLPR